jgi:alpha-N-arabinofuranosidase
MHKNVGYQSGANLAEPQKEQQMTQEIAFRPFRSIQCRILRQSQVRRTFLFAFQAGSPLVRSLFASLTLLVVATAVPVATAQKIQLSVDVSKPGPKIDRNLFGQFAEHLGHGVYEGIWVGPDSKIPNTRGIRNDVVAALKSIKVPNVRWPGGCFADEYHWRKGIGQQRTVTLNPNWGGVIEPNTFGTTEFMDFLDQIGAEAYLSVNVGQALHGKHRNGSNT